VKQGTNSAHAKPSGPPVAEIVAHLVTKDFRAALGAVAQQVAAYTEARAVSLACVGEGETRARAGTWPDGAAPKVDSWERALAEQTKRGATTLPQGPLPVSMARGADWALCAAPLVAGQQVVGLLSLCVASGDEVRAAQRLRDMAPWLGGVLHLAQARETAHLQVAALGTLLRQAQAWTAEPDTRAALRAALQVLATLFGAQGGLIAALDDEAGVLRCLGAYIPNEALDWTGARLRPAGILHHACVSGETVVCNEPDRDPRYAPDVEGALVASLRSLVAVPIRAPGGRRGVLAIFNRAGASGFRPADASLIAGVATLVSAILETAWLRQAMDETREQWGALPRSIRTEIAGTLHQGPIQVLAAVAMGLDHVEHLLAAQPDAAGEEIKSLKALTREATREARLLLFELRPTLLETEGLAGTLAAYIQQLPEESVRVHLDSSGPVGEIPLPVAEAAFHAAAQGIRHARLHGQATEIGLTLVADDEALTLTLEDNGKPHGERRCTRGEVGVGCVAAIGEQLAPLGGTLDLREASAGRGPTVQIRIPLGTRRA